MVDHSGDIADQVPMALDEAVALAIRQLPSIVGTEMLDLDRADGCTAAEDVVARNAVPPFASSAVDGYAVRHADLRPMGETCLPLGGSLTAGSAEIVSAAGRAVRIFTGAAMPADADTVFMQEEVRSDGESVHLPAGQTIGANVRCRGEDVAHGERIIAAGRRLTPQDIALAASAGHKQLAVRRPLRVAVFSTGNELAVPGTSLQPGMIYESNGTMLAALLRRLGLDLREFAILTDESRLLGARLVAAARQNDLVLTTGGVSVGDEDHVKSAIESEGRLLFWKLAIKPGRPLAMGVIEGTPIVALPGNPLAAYVTFAFFVRPVLVHLAGGRAGTPVPLTGRAAFAMKKGHGRREFIPVRLARGSDGVPQLHRLPKQGSLAMLTASDGLADIGDGVADVSVGDVINFYPHYAFW